MDDEAAAAITVSGAVYVVVYVVTVTVYVAAASEHVFNQELTYTAARKQPKTAMTIQHHPTPSRHQLHSNCNIVKAESSTEV